MESSADYFLPLRLDIEYSICCPVTHKFFHSCVETDNIANCVSTSMLISSSFQRFISFRYFPFIYILINTQLFKGMLCRFPELSLCEDISFFFFFFVSLNLHLCQLIRDSAGPCFPPPCLAACKLLKVVSWTIV